MVVFVAFHLLPLTHSLLLVLMTPLTYTLSSLSVTIGRGVLFTRTIYTLQHYYLAHGRSGTVLHFALSSYVVSIAHYSISLGICTTILKNKKCHNRSAISE
jgi:hypothetical protein